MESTRKWIVMMGWVELGCFSHFSFRSKIVALLEKKEKKTPFGLHIRWRGLKIIPQVHKWFYCSGIRRVGWMLYKAGITILFRHLNTGLKHVVFWCFKQHLMEEELFDLGY